jgi:hypothetical protein
MIKAVKIGMVLAAACLGAWGYPAAGNGGQSACKDDIARFCKDVKPGGGRLSTCLKAHASELSAACRESVAAAKAKLQGAHEACADDVHKFCAEVNPGAGRVLRCLRENQTGLSPECRERLGSAGKRPQ